MPRLREDPAIIDPMSWNEVRLLFDKGFQNEPEMRRLYTVAIFTGLRTSELIGLKWGDLDWTSTPPLAVIKHSFTKHDGEHLTKTPGSARSVDLRPQVVRALKEQKTSSRLKSDFVFCSSVGGPLNRDNLMNRVWYPALKRAGIRERKPYQTRHTFATALSAGEAIGWMSKQMGHSNTKMIIEHYYRFIPNLTRQDGSAFDKAAAQFGLYEQRWTAEKRQKLRQKLKEVTGPVSRNPSSNLWSGRPDSNRRRPAWEASRAGPPVKRREDTHGALRQP